MKRSPAGAVAVTLLALGCTAGSPDRPGFDTLDVGLGPVADFALTDQDGHTVRRADLRGKVWVASFLFTRCPGECVEIAKNLAELQRHLGRGQDVLLVSFTVDPEHDTPEVLNAYAAQKGADRARWLFLTGPERALQELVVESFKQGLVRREKGRKEYDITHSPRLVVVDAGGEIRGYADGTKPDELPRLRARLRGLVLERYHYLPTVNGALNAAAALLLVAGYVAVRRRRLEAHKVLMLAALGVSAVFLVCYLFFHFVLRPNGFPGEGGVRTAYLAVLGSHSALAAVVAPLALVTAYRGLRDQRPRHVRLARWTLPVWLYVSVTGVVVYWMRYHLYP